MSNNNVQIAPNAAQNNVAIDVAKQLGNKQLPTNDQISELMQKTQNFLDEKKNDATVPPDTLKTLSDFQDVLQATEQLNRNKNQDESIQKILLETGTAAQQIGQQGKDIRNDPSLQGKGNQLGSQAKDLSQSVLEILKLMITNGQFRGQINSLIGLVQEMFLSEAPSSGDDSQDDQQLSQQQAQVPQEQHSTGLQGNEPAVGEISEENLIKPSAIPSTSVTPSNTAEQELLKIKAEQSTALMAGSSSGGNSRSWRVNPPSDEKKQELAFHFLSIMRNLNQNQEFKTGLQDLVEMFQDLRQESAPHTQMKEAIQSNEHVDTATSEAKKLIETFSHRPIDPFIVKVKEFFVFIRTDQRSRTWFDGFVGLLKDSSQKPHELDEFDFTKRVEKLISDASQLTQEEEFRNRYSDVGGELRAIAVSIKEDEDVKNLQIQTQKFLSNFVTTDENGVKTFNTDLVQQMRTFIIPLLIAQLDNVPIPPIQGSNDDMDYYFENMVLSGRDIIPDHIDIHTRGDYSIDVNRLSPHHAQSTVFVEINNIKPVISDIHFKFTRKTFPKISDDGIANVKITDNNGISIRLACSLAKAPSPQGDLFRLHLDRVDTDVSKVNIEIVQAKHDILLKIGASMYQSKIKSMLQKNISQKITQAFERIETGMNSLMERYPPSRLTGAASSGLSSAANKAVNMISSGNKTDNTSEQTQGTPTALQS